MAKIYETLVTGMGTTIRATNDDGSTSLIPDDLANSDYQEYLATL